MVDEKEEEDAAEEAEEEGEREVPWFISFSVVMCREPLAFRTPSPLPPTDQISAA